MTKKSNGKHRVLDTRYSTQFRRDMKRAAKRGKNLSKLQAISDLLAADEPLAPKHRDHALVGKYAGYRECHIEPDWLLVYKKFPEKGELLLAATGTHADLF